MSRMVLVVEDGEVEAELLERGLRDKISASAVVLIRGTAEAERYLCSPKVEPLPSLVVLDLKGPQMLGVELLKKVRSTARTRSVPVVVISGELADNQVRDLYRSGANSYLDRPVDGGELVSMISTATRYWLSLNMNAPANR